MKKLHVLLAATVGFCPLVSDAQVWVNDSVSMGPGYFQDIHYSMKNGQQMADSNAVWHLAFQMTPFPNTSVAIRANHAAGAVKVWSLGLSATARFANLTAADTVGKTADSRQLYNGSASWDLGAFNRYGNGVFNYGWGTYSQSTHDVTGDSLYLIRVGSAVYKFWPQFYNSAPNDSILYRVRVARFDGTGDRVVNIPRYPTFTGRNFAYYNLNTDVISNREPLATAWDIVFTRYVDTAYMGATPVMYPVTGVLFNYGVEVARVYGPTPPAANTYAAQTYSTAINTIGSNWKYLNGQQFALDTVSYFVKTLRTNEYYQLQFTRFDGTSTGKTVFARRKVADVTSVATAAGAPAVQFALVPNPARSSTQVMVDAPAAGYVQILLTDLAGRTAYRTAAPLAKGLNGFTVPTSGLPAGLYVVTVTNGQWTASAKLTVQQ